MYTSKTITRPDGSKYVQCRYIEEFPSEWSEDQDQMQRAIDQFGTSS
jgi:hypothetical protein